MYAVSYKTTSLPYYFSRSNSIGSFAKEQVSTVSSGREGIISKGGGSIYFAIGDITVDGNAVAFVEVEDTANVTNISKLNTYLISQPFQVTSSSNFRYSVSYGVIDSIKLLESLNEGEFVKYKVEIVNALSGSVIGVFDEVTYSNKNVKEYDNIAWEVATEELSGEQNVVLRLRVETNFNCDVSFAEKYADGSAVASDLSKRHPRKRSMKREQLVTDYSLFQNYPNPFNPSTTIKYALPKAGNVVLKVYDVLGKEVASLVNNHQESGRYSVSFDGSNLASGMYFYKLTSDSFTEIKKMMLVK